MKFKGIYILSMAIISLASCTKEVEYARVRLDFFLSDNAMTKVTTAGSRKTYKAGNP